MKHLSKSITYGISSALAAIAAISTIIISEKSSLNKHKKIVDMDHHQH